MSPLETWLLKFGYEAPSYILNIIILCLGLILTWALLLSLNVIANIFKKWAQKTKFNWDNQLAYIIGDLRGWFLFSLFLFLITKTLYPKPSHLSFLKNILVISSLLQIGIIGFYLLNSWREKVLIERREKDPSAVAALGLISKIFQVLFIILLFLLGLSNLGIDVGALIAGLGIGGIAIALAAQNVLGDLLASLSIVFDKPFVVGDFIVVGTERGTIEHIGIKTTRLRSLSGEELILSNKDLLESRVHNFKRMWRRRVVQKIGVLYSTPPEILEKIPQWIEEIVKNNENIDFDRCHFINFGESSLDIEFVFFVNNPEYNVTLNYQQKILIKILSKFNQENIGFAFPTRSLHLESIPKLPINNGAVSTSVTKE